MKTQETPGAGARPDDKNPRPIEVTVNGKTVTFTKHRATGMEIKETAIAQGVNIQRDFVLFELVGEGGHMKAVGDNDEVALNKESKFRAVAPDDNS